MIDWQPRARALAAGLADQGDCADPAWQQAFAGVPRHHFVRRFFQGAAEITDGDGDRWLDAVYADEVLMIARRPMKGTRTPLPTSSSSQPAIMAVMLDRLSIQPGMRVLEIGTGSGYNAALLCHRLGDSLVSTVDLDPELTAVARQRLAELGYRPSVRAADGLLGDPPHAPYDRIIATCSIGTVSPAWIRQLAPGGRIVAPFAGGGLLTLDKIEPEVVEGRFDAAPALFMPLRPRVDDPLGFGEELVETGGHPEHGWTGADPARLAVAGPDLRLWLQLHLPGLQVERQRHGLLLHTGGAVARIGLRPRDGRWSVAQQGSRRIWATVVAALADWDRLEHPARTRLGITASTDPAGQYGWLDDPAGPHHWPLVR